MSTYSQSEVARIVESVLPDILKSGDPHTTLIKRATELNLPPSVLEKAGQVYNTAKTLNHLDGVDDLEKRGNTFSTLDVPALLEAYEGYDPKEASKPVAFDDPWQAALFDKAASANTPNEYELPENFNPLFADKKDLLEKMASTASVNSFDGEDRGEAIRKHNAKVAAERDLETCRDLVNTLERNFLRKAAAIADQYLGLYVDAPAMDRLEAEVAKVTNKPELVKQAFDKVAAFIRQHPAAVKHIKRANDKTVTGLVLETGYHDLVKQALDHLELLNAAHEEYACLEKIAKPAVGFGGNKDDDDDDDDDDEKGKKGDEEKNELALRGQTPLSQPNETIDTEYVGEEDLSGDAEDLPSKPPPNDTTEVKTTEVNEPEVNEGRRVNLYNKELALKAVWNNPHLKNMRSKGLNAAKNQINQEQHERQAEIDQAGLLARGEAALNTLLLTDPVISEYDEEQMRDIFFTVLRENPDVATDINELRGILRAAGSFDGVVDVEAAKQLKTLRKLDREAATGQVSQGDDDKKGGN